ncbi:MAG: transporter substrate-binding domain-containing protein [Rhizobiaceae bacterium]
MALLLSFLAVLPVEPEAQGQGVSIPNFWDPGERLAKPDMDTVGRIRFLTTTDFPPFNFIDRKRRLTGFHVDLARAICAELGILPKCQIQAVPWDELATAIEKGDGEAIIAGMDVTPDTVSRYEFSRPFMRIPARLVARREDAITEPIYVKARRLETGLVSGSAHEKWFTASFPGFRTRSFPTRQEALESLRKDEIDLVFSDALSLSFWLQSPASADCCNFAGSAYIGDGSIAQNLVIAFPKGRTDLSSAADYALKEINDKGIFAELYLRYFPLGLY